MEKAKVHPLLPSNISASSSCITVLVSRVRVSCSHAVLLSFQVKRKVMGLPEDEMVDGIIDW